MRLSQSTEKQSYTVDPAFYLLLVHDVCTNTLTIYVATNPVFPYRKARGYEICIKSF